MSNIIRRMKATLTVVGGATTFDLSVRATYPQFQPLLDSGGELRQVLVKAPNTTDEFNFAIRDSDSIDVFDKDNAKGKINDTPNIPVVGAYSIVFDEAADGDYIVKLILAGRP